MNFELNNVVYTNKEAIRKGSPVSETFNVWVGNNDFSRMDARKVEASKNYIMGLAKSAGEGDTKAINEINTLRTIAIEDRLFKAIPNLAVFGAYQTFGMNETVEREVYIHSGERSRVQAAGGDPVFPAISKEVYQVPVKTITGGYVVDYRRMESGDMTQEAKGIAQVVTDMYNRIVRLTVEEVYKKVKASNGVKRFAEFAGVTQTAVDKVIQAVRREGRPSLLGDMNLLDQFAGFAGYKGSVDSTTITGISDATMDEIRINGHPAIYKACSLVELPNPYDYSSLNGDGTDFATYLPQGLGIITVQGANAPVFIGIRGGLTSLQGVNVKTGKIETRYDIDVAVDVCDKLVDQIAVIYDTNLGGLE